MKWATSPGAWGLGAVVGLVMRTDERSIPRGAVAGAVAVGGVILAKFLIVDRLSAPASITDDDVSFYMRKDLLVQKGYALRQGADGTPEPTKVVPSEVEEGIDREIADRLPHMTLAEKREAVTRGFKIVVAATSFWVKVKIASSEYDVLWYSLAVFTAFGFGSGLRRGRS